MFIFTFHIFVSPYLQRTLLSWNWNSVHNHLNRTFIVVVGKQIHLFNCFKGNVFAGDETEAQGLTSNIFKVDGLSVGVEQLDYGVVVVLHSAADGGRFPLDHRHIVSRQVLAFNFTQHKENKCRWRKKNYVLDGRTDIY